MTWILRLLLWFAPELVSDRGHSVDMASVYGRAYRRHSSRVSVTENVDRNVRRGDLGRVSERKNPGRGSAYLWQVGSYLDFGSFLAFH